jgi:DNA (cytosine-5)-methyltransferase 1
MTLSEDAVALEALRGAYSRYSRQEIADELGLSIRTLVRWETKGQIASPRMLIRALNDLLRDAPELPKQTSDFTFIDLFAGIGGTRLGFQAAGGECVFTSEYDKHCAETYRANFRPSHEPAGDIREVKVENIPDHDVLVAGFPCQPFSIAGVSKKNSLGRAHGFACETQGTLFFDICRILEAKRPIAFMLENVRNLKSHDGGRTFKVIVKALAEIGYQVDFRVIDAQAWVPQHRERIFIVGFRQQTAFTMDQIQIPQSPKKKTLDAILHPENGTEASDGRFICGPGGAVHPRYTLTAHLWRYLRNYAEKHRAKGNGFGFGLVGRNDVARTLSARYFKDGSEILIDRGSRKTPRRLTPRECARLMGFPDSFVIPVSDTQAYKQFGNSVVVPVVEAVAQAMRPFVLSLKLQQDSRQIAMVA